MYQRLLGLGMQPDQILFMPLVHRFPVHDVVVTFSRVDAGPQADIDQFGSLIFVRGDAIANRPDMLIGQVGEAFTCDMKAYASGALPMYRSANNAIAHIQLAVIGKDCAPIEPETLAVDKKLDAGPVGSVGKLLLRYWNIVENAEYQGRGTIPRVAFLEGTARAKITIANGIDSFLTMQLFKVWIKPLFVYKPKIHKRILPNI